MLRALVYAIVLNAFVLHFAVLPMLLFLVLLLLSLLLLLQVAVGCTACVAVVQCYSAASACCCFAASDCDDHGAVVKLSCEAEVLYGVECAANLVVHRVLGGSVVEPTICQTESPFSSEMLFFVFHLQHSRKCRLPVSCSSLPIEVLKPPRACSLESALDTMHITRVTF